MKFWLVCSAVLLSGYSSFGQNAAPNPLAGQWADCPSSAMSLNEPQAPASDAQTNVEDRTAPPAADPSSVSKPHPRVADRNFVLANMFQIASTIANIEALEYEISRGNGPGNTPNGRPPSRALLYGLAMPISAANVGLTYHIKKKYPHSHKWLLIPAIEGGIELSAAIYRFKAAK